MWRVFIVLLLVSLLPQTPSLAQADPCSGLVSPRLQPGQTARVVFDNDGIGNVVRDGPGKDQSGSNVIGAIAEGTVVTIVEGPTCLDGLVWWSAELPNGTVAWTAEGDTSAYFLEPFDIGVEVTQVDSTNPRQINRYFVTYSRQVVAREPFIIPGGDPVVARDLWQQPDIDAANAALADRRANCPQVLTGTPWENTNDAANVTVPEGDFTYYPSPDGGKLFLVRHRVLPIPTCGGGPGQFYGINTTHLVTTVEVSDLFPFGLHNGARSKESCQSPDVPNLAWTTDLSEVHWSQDADTLALTVRYLDQDDNGRNCAYYFIFMVEIFSGQVTPIAEARRAVWAGGGSRLNYFRRITDNGYNVLEEQLWELNRGQNTQLGLPGGAQFVPTSFDSTGVILPQTDDGSRLLVCNTLNGCPDTLTFEIVDRSFSPAIVVPEGLLPYQIAKIHYVAGNTRVLWLTTEGELYIQAVEGVDTGLWASINLPTPDTRVENIITMPTGIAAILILDNGDYLLLNTISRQLEALPEITR